MPQDGLLSKAHSRQQRDPSQSDPLLEHLMRCQKCKKSMTSLVKRYGPEICQWALNQIFSERVEDERNRKSRVGRKKEFEVSHLRDVWIFVESGKLNTKLSAKTFCKRAKFQWLSIGPNGAKVKKEVGSETLRRRYQQAVMYLRSASAPYKKLAKLQGSTSATAMSPEETWWKKLLKEYRASLCGKPT